MAPAVAEEAEELVELAHGVVVPEIVALTVMLETAGVGTVISGLAPVVLVSTAPSGTLPPFRAKLELAPSVETGEEVPVVNADDEDAQLEVELADPAALNPPPSKIEPADVVDVMLLVPGICEFEEPLALQVGVANGLKPPGSISVAASGVPVPLVPLAPLVPNVPSGEVVPIAGRVVEVCALVAAQPKNSASIAIDNRRIEKSPVPVAYRPLLATMKPGWQVEANASDPTRQCKLLKGLLPSAYRTYAAIPLAPLNRPVPNLNLNLGLWRPDGGPVPSADRGCSWTLLSAFRRNRR